MPITFQKANDILIHGFPEGNDLELFPFGKYLQSLCNRGDEDSKDYLAHAPKVIDAMNDLLGNEPENILGNRSDADAAASLGKAQMQISSFFGNVRHFDGETKFLFRLAALYHDIGKYIIKERHPTVGRYTMEYMDPTEKDDLRVLLQNREDNLQLLLVMIRDHDQFGVLSTGEASYPILLGAASSLGNSVEDQCRTISAIMWLNLADMAGIPGLHLTGKDLKKVITDWEWYQSALSRSAVKNERLDDFVIREASEEPMVVQRICRLILEASRKSPGRLSELSPIDEKKEGERIKQLVRNQLSTVYSTPIPRQEFASQFTHICKLDYGKRFFNDLVEYCEGPQKSRAGLSLLTCADERVKTDRVVYAVLAILRRITSTYSAMIRSESGPGNLIGVEMKDLTPRNAPEKTAQICKLLLESHYPGLSWLMSDCPAWYF